MRRRVERDLDLEETHLETISPPAQHTQQSDERPDNRVAGALRIEPEETAVEGGPVGSLRRDVEPMGEEKRAFDQAYLDGRFADVEHELAWIPQSLPSLAVSSFFSIGYNSWSSQEMPVALNVFPHDGGHAIVFSFRRPSKPLAQDLVFALKRRVGEERFRAVSRLVLKNSDNFVLRPSLYRRDLRARRLQG